MVMCWAPDCKHYNVREKCKFFTFPKDIKERNRWIRLLRRTDEPGRGAVVCSCHFRGGIKSNGPEIFEHNVAKRQQFLYSSPEKQKRKHKVEESKKGSGSPSKTGSTQFSEVNIQHTALSPDTKEVGDMGPSTSKHMGSVNLLTRFDQSYTTAIPLTQPSDVLISQQTSALESTSSAIPSTSTSRTEVVQMDVTELSNPEYPPTPISKTIMTLATLEAENYFLKQELEKSRGLFSLSTSVEHFAMKI